MTNQIKVGDRVCVKNWQHLPAVVSDIYMENKEGIKTKWEFDCSRVVIELDWKEHGKSKVALHDQNNTWFLYKSNN